MSAGVKKSAKTRQFALIRSGWRVKCNVKLN